MPVTTIGVTLNPRYLYGISPGEDAKYVYPEGRASMKEDTNVVRDNWLGGGQPVTVIIS